MQCSVWDEFRKPLLAEMDAVGEDFSGQNDKDKAADYQLHEETIVYCLLLTLWSARFY